MSRALSIRLFVVLVLLLGNLVLWGSKGTAAAAPTSMQECEMSNNGWICGGHCQAGSYDCCDPGCDM